MAIKATNQIDIVDLTDGYSVFLSSDSFTVVGNKNGAATAQTNAFSISITAVCGDDVVPCTVAVATTTGISAGTQSISSNVVTIPFSVTSSLVNSGTITLTISITGTDISIQKKVPVTVAKTGADGAQGPQGEQGIQGVQGETGPQGPQGDDGEDAILLVITSSAGTIFKNTQAATTLTAHVYKGGVELNSSQISALGTVKWYKDSGSTAVGTGLTYGVSAGTVTNKATYTAKLESS